MLAGIARSSTIVKPMACASASTASTSRRPCRSSSALSLASNAALLSLVQRPPSVEQPMHDGVRIGLDHVGEGQRTSSTSCSPHDVQGAALNAAETVRRPRARLTSSDERRRQSWGGGSSKPALAGSQRFRRRLPKRRHVGCGSAAAESAASLDRAAARSSARTPHRSEVIAQHHEDRLTVAIHDGA